MSANERTATVFECIQGGAEDYLVKPVTRNAIQCIWQHVWRRQNAARVPQATDEVNPLAGISGKGRGSWLEVLEHWKRGGAEGGVGQVRERGRERER